MELRPHHLLCTQGYSGKGYNQEFVHHMTAVVKELRENDTLEINLVFSTDELCSHCPHKQGEDQCKTNEKVKQLDQKVITYFGLEEKPYIYQEIVREIKQKMTQEMMNDICGACSWYEISACQERILDKKDSK